MHISRFSFRLNGKSGAIILAEAGARIGSIIIIGWTKCIYTHGCDAQTHCQVNHQRVSWKRQNNNILIYTRTKAWMYVSVVGYSRSMGMCVYVKLDGFLCETQQDSQLRTEIKWREPKLDAVGFRKTAFISRDYVCVCVCEFSVMGEEYCANCMLDWIFNLTILMISHSRSY